MPCLQQRTHALKRVNDLQENKKGLSGRPGVFGLPGNEEPMSIPYKRVNRKVLHKGAVVEMCQDTIEFPDGSRHHWDFISHPGGACVVAVLPDGRLLMVRQYRNALERETLELPAGGKAWGEDPKVCALRELEEETGYRAGHCEQLACIASNVALMNEKIGVYLCTELVPTSQHLDDGEYLGVEAYELSELLDMIFRGELQDAKTVTGILAYRVKLTAGAIGNGKE